VDIDDIIILYANALNFLRLGKRVGGMTSYRPLPAAVACSHRTYILYTRTTGWQARALRTEIIRKGKGS